MTTDQAGVLVPEAREGGERRFLFVACFVALVATSFAFIIRVMLMDQWQIDFGLSETQKGEIFGAGMWPFGLSIVLFSLVIDKVGYGRSMIFAFACHFVSAFLMMFAEGYWWLYAGSILNGLAAGTVEAVINPAIASMYPKKKTTMLTILHAGWPGGFVLGGITIFILRALGVADWRVNVGIILVPTVLYGVMLLKAKFPVSERVVAGVTYRDMLKEAGAIGWLIVVYLICMEINRVAGLGNLVDTTFFDLPSLPMTIVIVVLTFAYLIYTQSAGRPMYIFLLLVMILLAITELGTDTWIKELMGPSMEGLRIDAGWVLVYTATIMMVLRFCIAPIVKVLKPLGVLFASALLAACGLYFLSTVEGVMILVMATIYGTGQCFFWPVTLGLVAEQFPRGGALTLNAIAGVGMLGVGILGSQLLGFWQDTSIDAQLDDQPVVCEEYMGEDSKQSIFGNYRALDVREVNEMNDTMALYEYRRDKAKEMAGAPADEAITAALADDPLYQTLVRKAYNHLVRPEGDTEEKTFAEMHAALEANDIFIGEQQYAEFQDEKKVLDEVRADAKRDAMKSVAVLPLIMAACYLGLILYFRAKGGYKAVELTLTGAEDGGTHEPTAEEFEEDAEKGPQR